MQRASKILGANVQEGYVRDTKPIEATNVTNTGLNNTKADKEDTSNSLSVLEEMQKRQVELQKKLEQMENDALRRQLNDEIERKINATGILNDFDSFRKDSVKKVIYNLYYDSLIETEKYKKLKE